MRTFALLLAVACAVSGFAVEASARSHRHKHHRHIQHHRHYDRGGETRAALARGMVTIATAAGEVTVAPSFVSKIRPFIADVVARGFHGRVHCFAAGGHVRNSRHYLGMGCDFAQSGRDRTVYPMRHVRDLADRYGLRDGCTFRDCGHIDIGLGVGTYRVAASQRRHIAMVQIRSAALPDPGKLY